MFSMSLLVLERSVAIRVDGGVNARFIDRGIDVASLDGHTRAGLAVDRHNCGFGSRGGHHRGVGAVNRLFGFRRVGFGAGAESKHGGEGGNCEDLQPVLLCGSNVA